MTYESIDTKKVTPVINFFRRDDGQAELAPSIVF